jgi:hypothetical protein
MPWFPDFVSAVEQARRQTRAAGRVDPVGRYIAALNSGDTHDLETTWPGEVVVYDPHAGEVRGHKQLGQWVRRSQSRLADLHARVETAASTVVDGRAVVELLAHVDTDRGHTAWPVAVVAESPNDITVVFRSYFSRWPVEGKRYLRPAILPPGPIIEPGDVVGQYQTALTAGDTDGVVGTFEPDGYYREPMGPPFTHRGTSKLRDFFTRCFSAGGGIGLQPCAVTDDGVRCALEYNCVGWGSHELPPQAGIAVYERGPDGLLAAVRVYDDVEPPIDSI